MVLAAPRDRRRQRGPGQAHERLAQAAQFAIGKHGAGRGQAGEDTGVQPGDQHEPELQARHVVRVQDPDAGFVRGPGCDRDVAQHPAEQREQVAPGDGVVAVPSAERGELLEDGGKGAAVEEGRLSCQAVALGVGLQEGPDLRLDAQGVAQLVGEVGAGGHQLAGRAGAFNEPQCLGGKVAEGLRLPGRHAPAQQVIADARAEHIRGRQLRLDARAADGVRKGRW